jgi:hypothetical protein
MESSQGHNRSEVGSTTTTNVRFAPKVRVKRVPSRHSYAADSKALLWFTKEQLRDLVQKNLAEVQLEPADWRDIEEDDDNDSCEDEDNCCYLYPEDDSSLEDDE